jgi:hypothetical protein
VAGDGNNKPSGTFDVEVDGHLVFSKAIAGGMPDTHALISAIVRMAEGGKPETVTETKKGLCNIM